MTPAEQRQRAIDLMARDIEVKWFRVGNHDAELLRVLVEPIVDHHAECAARLRREGER